MEEDEKARIKAELKAEIAAELREEMREEIRQEMFHENLEESENRLLRTTQPRPAGGATATTLRTCAYCSNQAQSTCTECGKDICMSHLVHDDPYHHDGLMRNPRNFCRMCYNAKKGNMMILMCVVMVIFLIIFAGIMASGFGR